MASKRPDPNRLRALFAPMVAGRRLRLVMIAVLSLVGGLFEALALILIARVAFALAGGESETAISIGAAPVVDGSATVLLIVAAGLVVARLGLQVVAGWLQAAMSASALADARQRTTTVFLAASWSLQSRERQGQLQELMTTYVTQATTALTALVGCLVAGSNLLALIVSAFLVNPVGAACVGLSAAGLLLLLRPMRLAVRHRSRLAAEMNLRYASVVSETAALAREIHVYDIAPAVQARLDAHSERSARTQRRTRLLSVLATSLYQCAALLLMIGALTIARAVGVEGLASLGAVVLIMLRSLSYSQAGQQQYQALFEAAPYVERLRDEQEQYREAAQPRSGRAIGRIDTVHLDRVSFDYTPGHPVLKGLSFDLRRGEIVGIVGPSGGGKSTLVQLLLRLREPTSGQLRANGIDVREIALPEWYQRVAYVPQEAGLFAGTVADNIRFFRDVGDDVLLTAAQLAHIDEDIRSWPLGYETPVGEQGSQLSGGQRQRLCIARALVNKPDLLVLDEPTSALDARSESLIRETLRAMAPNTTVVIIAHRLSTLDICDRIMVLQHGVITGFDAPGRLETDNPFYREAVRLSAPM